MTSTLPLAAGSPAGPGPDTGPGTGPATGPGYGFRQVARAELLKLVTLRSTFWTLLVTVAGSVVVTVLTTAGVGHHPRAWYRGFDPTNESLAGLLVAVLAIGVLGALAVTGEYASGTIRSSLAATPRRPLLLAGKVAVVGAAALAVGEVLTLACFGVGQAVLAGQGAPTAGLGQPGVLRAVLLSGAFLALLGLLALGLGVVLRHTAGALAAYVGVTFLLPLVLQRIPDHPERFTPVPMLASSVAAVHLSPGQVPPWAGFLLMALYAAAALGVAAALLARRDA
ncbi:MAG: ABC transporter permease subunit [Acidimicrobiales bacterium]